MHAIWNVIAAGKYLNITNPSEFNAALSVLNRLGSIGVLQFTTWFWNGAKIFIHKCNGFFFVNLTGNCEYCIVGLIIFFIKSLEVFYRNFFNVFL